MDAYQPRLAGHAPDAAPHDASQCSQSAATLRSSIDEEVRDRREIQRVLPLSPRWRSVAWTATVSSLTVMLWLGLLWWIPVDAFRAFLWPYGLVAALSMSLYLSVVSHIDRFAIQRWIKLPEADVGDFMGRGIVAMVAMMLTVTAAMGWAQSAGIPMAEFDYGNEWVRPLFVLSIMLIANVFTPMFIERWRGCTKSPSGKSKPKSGSGSARRRDWRRPIAPRPSNACRRSSKSSKPTRP